MGCKGVATTLLAWLLAGTAVAQTYVATSVPATPFDLQLQALDQFNTVAFSNNDGTLNWSGNWIEVDGDGLGPAVGNVLITGGTLQMDDRPDTGGQPSLEREVDLSGSNTASFAFDFQTTNGVDNSDAVTVEVSANGGAAWTTLEVITGINGASTQTRRYDITAFISAQTRVRFRVSQFYGGPNEEFIVDNVAVRENDLVWDQTNTNFPVDDDKQLANIGFTFMFGTTPYTQVRILSNGALHFGADQGFHKDWSNEALPITGFVNGPGPEQAADRAILPYWDDLNPANGGNVWYRLMGTAPNRRLVVTWEAVPHFPNSGSYTVQGVLSEDGEIRFRYGPGSANGASATIGVELTDADFTQFSFNQGGAVGPANDVVFSIPVPPDCGASFPGPLATTAPTGAIILGNGVSLTGTNAGQLTTSVVVPGPTATCDGGPCSADGGAAPTIALPANSSTAKLTGSQSFAAGDHFFAKSTVANNSVISVTGAGTARLFFNGDLKLKKGVQINPAGSASQLIIFVSGNLKIEKNVVANAIFYVTGSIDIKDNVQINGALTAGSASTVGNNTSVSYSPALIAGADFGGLCTAAVSLHIAIVHDGTAVSCQAEPITIAIHDSGHALQASYNGTVNLSTSTGHGDWSVLSAVPGTLVNSGNGNASYTFNGAEGGQVTLGLLDTLLETTNINAVDSVDVGIVEDPGEDPDLVVSGTGFRFLAGGVPDVIAAQIAGKPTGTAPVSAGSSLLELEAIRTSDQTGACEAAFQGFTPIDLAFECRNPITCSGVTLDINGTAVPGNNNGSVVNFTSVNLDFGNATDTTAPIALIFNDVGQIRLHAHNQLPAGGQLMQGASNDFVVRPFGFHLGVSGGTEQPGGVNPGASTAGGLAFTRAGVDFNLAVRAVAWQAVDDAAPVDGVPDGHNDTDPATGANLGDNLITPNFGRETVAQDVTASAVLFLPNPGNNPGLAGATAVSGFAAGQAAATVHYDDVGIVEISAGLAAGSYLGTQDAPGRSGFVGRIIPHHFTTTLNAPQFNTFCGGAGGFTYIGQPFDFALPPVITVTAQTLNNATTQNYTAAFWRIDNTTLSNRQYLDPAHALDLAALPLTGVDPLVADGGGGSGTLTFNLDFAGVPSTFLSYLRGATEFPFNSTIDLSIDIADSDGVGDGVDTNVATVFIDDNPLPAVFNSIAFSGSAEFRFGRVTLVSATGSELLDLAIPMQAEYFTANGGIPNVQDSCTGTGGKAGNIAITLNVPAMQGVTTCVQDNGNPGLSGAGCPVPGPLVKRIVIPPLGADFNLWLAPPNPVATGFVDISASVPPWLQFDWKGAGNQDPTARGSFGLFSGNQRVIDRREQF